MNTPARAWHHRQGIKDAQWKDEKEYVKDQIRSRDYSMFVGLNGGYDAATENDRQAIQDILDHMEIDEVLRRLSA